MSEIDLKIKKLAKELVLVEKKSFYGSEPERERLKKMRELIDEVSKELKDDS
jgi:hypothetical protein